MPILQGSVNVYPHAQSKIPVFKESVVYLQGHYLYPKSPGLHRLRTALRSDTCDVDLGLIGSWFGGKKIATQDILGAFGEVNWV
jgi:hypothetical protein